MCAIKAGENGDYMKASELIAKLASIVANEGDLEVKCTEYGAGNRKEVTTVRPDNGEFDTQERQIYIA